MKAPTLLLVASVALLLVVQRSSAKPCKKRGAVFVRAAKCGQSARSAATSADSNDEEISANSAAGQYRKRASSSSSKSLAQSSDSNSESYESYNAGAICGCALKLRNSGESDVSYYSRIFAVDVANAESVNAFYAKLFKQYKGECDADYVKRINFIFTSVYPQLDCRCNNQYAKFLEKYYTIYYARRSGECDSDYFQRVLTRTTESETEYQIKVSILKKFISNVDWNLVQIDPSSETGYILVSGNSSSRGRSISRTLTEEDIKKTFAKVDSEDITTYFKRITAKSEITQEYINTLTLARKCYPNLALWYDPNYIDLVKDYYTVVFTKQSDEDEDVFFKRIVTKEDFETDEQCAQRIDVIRSLNPNLSLWSDEKYYESLTKRYYLTVFKKTTTEDEVSYYRRILTQTTQETDTEYVNRISLIKRTFSTLPVWYSTNCLDVLRKYYTVKYTKLSTEKEEDYFKRIVTKEVGESDQDFALRVEVVRQYYPNIPLWADDKYYDSFTKNIYQTVFKKSTTEDEVSYYTRIVTQTEKETDTEYINRLSLIKRTFSTLPLWYSKDYFNIIRKFYMAKYTKFSSENEESQFKRITIKEIGETDEQFIRRVELIHECYPNLSLWTDEKYYDSFTKNIYATVFKKTSTEDDLTYYKRILSKTTQETEVEYVNRITLIKRTFSTLPLWYSKDYFDVVRDYYITKYTKISTEKDEEQFKRIVTKEVGETDEDFALRVELVRHCFPNSPLWADEKYYDSFTKKIYQTIYKKSSTEDELSYYKRIVKQTEKETDTEYINRISLIKRTYSSLPLWYSKDYLSVIRKYYIAKYTKSSTETDETQFKRIVTKEVDETDEQFIQRAELVHECFPNLRLWIDDTYYDTFTKKVYLNIYKKTTTEDELNYYKRIITKTEQETDIEYINRMTLIKRTLNTLPLWYSKDYLDVVKSFYMYKYTKLSSETEEAHFNRIIIKEDGETDEQYFQRAEIVRQLFPNFSLWYSEKYYNSFSKNFYLSLYKKSTAEDETSYFKRICTKSASESDAVYVARMNLIEQTYSNLPLWYNVQNLDIVKQYYLLKYAQQSGETNEAFLSRVLARDVCDSSDEILAQRIYLVQQLTVSNAVWYDEQFYDKYTKSFYTTYYKPGRNEGCDGLLTRVIRQLPGESEEYAFKRIALIKRATSDCGCWNLDSLSKLEASKAFSAEYIAKIRNAFFVTSYSKKSSSSSSSSKSASSEQNEDVVVIKRGEIAAKVC